MKTSDYADKYARWIEKKISEKPVPMQKLLRRSYNSGLMVLGELDGISFTKLSSSLYFMCQDVQAEGLSHKYEALLELAGANPDRFMVEIHKSINDVARFVKNNSLMPEFCEFISACDRLKAIKSVEDIEVWHVMNAYMDLLFQTCSYLVPAKYDCKQRVCGCSTAGEILLCDEYYPHADDVMAMAAKTVEEEGFPAIAKCDSIVAKFASRYGYTDITSSADLDRIMLQDNYHSAQIGCLITYINEYTYDMLPDTGAMFAGNFHALTALQIDNLDPDTLVHTLSGRARTLPSNGLLVEFMYDTDDPSPNRLQSLVMKEVLHDDRIVMLYKIRFSDQVICGYYDIKDNFFHSLILESDKVEEVRLLHEKMRLVILYLYAAATSRMGEQMFSDFGTVFFSGVREEREERNSYPISVKPYFRGGKPRNTYLEGDKTYNPSGPRLGDDRYEQEERSIQGYVRKVGKGRTPSREAVERAEALGFSLEPDETYVQPFTMHVLRLRRK